MKNNSFKKLNNGIWKKIAIASTCLVAVLLVGILATTHAKYKLTESINIVNGTINYKVPDLKVMAIYTSENGTNYIETTTMPTSGYIINEEKTYCTTDNINQVKGKAYTNSSGELVFRNLTKSDKCYLYFDKYVEPSIGIPDIIAVNNPKTTAPNFGTAATTDEGVYKASDGMYGGNSYYWRGAVVNNYVKFANFCWRIVRINGDGSIRLIYDGTTCHVNGTIGELAVTSQTYNASSNRNEYVGYTYTQGSQRGTTTASNLKTQTESWYKTNITDKGFDAKVATGKFCNDRNTASGYTWNSQPSNALNYAVRERLESAKTPTLSCSNSGDIYSLKVGSITADEISFAGGVYGTANSSYYLYNNQDYWTISPRYWNSYSNDAWMYRLDNSGSLMCGFVNATNTGIRPVINLKADITFKQGTDGTLNNPYEVI